MSTDPNRDPLDDRLLRRALRPDEPVSADACLDAERLAAWTSGTLTADATEDIDRHLATCARCQALLGAFTATEDSAANVAPTVVPFRARPVARWIPLVVGTLAASLVVWIAWPRPAPADRVDQTMAAATPQPAATAEPTPPPVLGQTRVNDQAQATPPASRIADARPPRANIGRGTAPSQPADPRATPAPIAPQPRPLAAPPPVPLPSPTAVTAGAAASAAAPPPPQAGAGAGAAGATTRQEVVALRGTADAMAKAAEPARVIAEFSSPATTQLGVAQPLITGGAGAGGRGAGGGRGGGGGGGRGALQANRATARVNWRVLSSGHVERSVTGGDTWMPVTISPPAVILGGAAPSPSVCWLVGRTGIVLLSIDGSTFQRVFFPDVSDLRSVTAVDEREATVTTTDGRSFKTDDGGLTWKNP